MANPLNQFVAPNGDVDLTSAVSIFSQSNAGSFTRWVVLRFEIGDGSKDLASAADTVLTFVITRGGKYLTTLTVTVPDAHDQLSIDTEPITWKTGETIAVTLESDQAGDTDVDVTVEALDVSPLQPATSGRTLVVDADGEIFPADDSIKSETFDETTAFPLKQDDSGNSSVLRRGASEIDATDLETQIDIAQNDLDEMTDNGVDLVDAPNSTAITAFQSGLGTSAGQATIQTTQASHTASLASLSSSVSSVLSKMLAYFRLALRSDSGPTTDDSVELAEINGDGGSGVGNFDRTNSLEGIRDNQSGGGGGGGGTTLVVAPVAGVVTDRSQRADFELFRGEQRDNVVVVIDEAGDAVDLSGLTLRVVIEDGRSTDDIQAIEDGDISVSGDDNNVITFRNDPAVTASRRTLTWSLWSTGTNLAELLIRGEIKVVSVSQ